MATAAEWARGYARQADADLSTFEFLQRQQVPDCHRLLFLQMACEKLVKAYLCGTGSEPGTLQASHAYVAKHLPRVLEAQTIYRKFKEGRARQVLDEAGRLAREIELLAPAVKRGGQRPDNCEYPWEDDGGTLHVPLDWSFAPVQLIVRPAGPTILKLIRGAIDRLLI